MIIVMISIGFFLAFLAIHVIWWRTRLPSNTIRAIFRLYLVCMMVDVVILGAVTQNFAATLYGALIFALAGISYTITYTAVDSDSPTLMMVAELAARKDRGMSLEEMLDLVRVRPFVRSRVDQMLRDGMLVERGGRYALTDISSFSLTLFNTYRKLVNRGNMGG